MVISSCSFLPRTRGSAFYKLNVSLLKDKNYISLIKQHIHKTKNDPSYTYLTPHSRWELIKAEVKAVSQQYSKFLQTNKHNESVILQGNLETIEKRLSKDPKNYEAQQERTHIVKRLEILELEKTKGAQIRAGIKWIEEGEKCTKFFLNLEKSRAEGNTINILTKEDGDVLTSEKDIMMEIRRYYENLYKENNNENIATEETRKFAKDLNVPILSEQQKLESELNLAENEIHAAMMSMNTGSAPGSDGIGLSWYQMFWEDIKKEFMESLEYSHQIGRLSPTQRQGTISLIHKGKELPKEKLTNWRPISLTNTDYKIISKALALRLKKVLPSIIHDNQKGFINGRNISTAIREIDDIVEYESSRAQTESIALSIDYSKAFDTVSLGVITEALKLFGFGDNLISWIGVLLKDRLANIKNGGLYSDFFALERGVRQGCPVSPMLFVIAVELLSISVRQDNKIHGIKFPNSPQTIKILQYADDTTLFAKNLIDFREILAKIKDFSNFSGLRLNENKSKAMILSKTRPRPRTVDNIECVDKLKLLGIVFSSSSPAGEISDNWESKIEAIERTLNLWAKRDLSILGKITILKTFALSKINYIINSVGMPTNILNKLNSMFFRFLWKRKYSNTRAFEKVKRTVLCSDIKFGGLKMFNLTQIQAAAYLQWAEALLSDKEENWKLFPVAALTPVGFKAAFLSNSKKIKGNVEIKSLFWRKVLEAWVSHNDQKETLNFYSQPIFNNTQLTYQNEQLYIKRCIINNIIYVKDLFLNGNFISLEQFSRKAGPYPGIQLDYILLRAVILPKRANHATELFPVESPEILFKGQKIGKLKRKGFIKLISAPEKSHASSFWTNKYKNEVPENMWVLPWKCTAETRLRTLQWKILNNIYPTRILLEKMGLSPNNNCTRCNKKDYIEHFFAECLTVKPLWEEIENLLAAFFNKRIKLTTAIILFGINNENSTKIEKDIINKTLLIGKMCISKIKYGKHKHLISLFYAESNLRKLEVVGNT